ncbi:hypothetical protein ES708_17428 [subsurface metagenome]
MSNRLRRSADYRRSAVSLRIYAAGLGRILSCLFAEGILFGSGASLVVVVKLLVSFEQRRVVVVVVVVDYTADSGGNLM